MTTGQEGRGVFRLTSGHVVIALPRCAYCTKLAPDCRCGDPRGRKATETDDTDA